MKMRTNDLEAVPMPATIKTAWIHALNGHLGWNDLPRSWRLFNAVLHALHASDAGAPLAATQEAIRRCGTLARVLPADRTDGATSMLLQQVATGFMPDYLENPEDAVLAVLEVLEGEIDRTGLDEIRHGLQLSLEAPRKAISVRWKPAWLSAA